MSLEISIQNLADAINRATDTLTAARAITGGVSVSKPLTDAEIKAAIKAESAKPDTAAGALADAKAKAQAAAADKKAQEEAARIAMEMEEKEKAGAAPALDYEKDVKPAFVKFMGNKTVGKPGGIALLKEFGAAKGDEIPAERFQEFLDRIEELTPVA
jgi:hypothetical protein